MGLGGGGLGGLRPSHTSSHSPVMTMDTSLIRASGVKRSSRAWGGEKLLLASAGVRGEGFPAQHVEGMGVQQVIPSGDETNTQRMAEPRDFIEK